MSYYEQYRPPGRSNRSGRTNVDNDVFEGLPVKQWGHAYTHVSLVPPVTEVVPVEDDKWGEPPMPRDYQMLLPWTQQLLRLARSGKVGTKRKADPDNLDEENQNPKADDENAAEDAKPSRDEDRGYRAKKWKHVPDHQLEPEHKHFEFLAKRRKGLPNFYGADPVPTAAAVAAAAGLPLPMRKTRVKRTDAEGAVLVYDVLVPEGHTLEGELNESELTDVTPVQLAAGTVIEGVGVANDEGIAVAEHLKPSAAAVAAAAAAAAMPRRNRPPPKKKGGPGRGKKRVTFTNPDGSTYTTVVPNATKIVPRPGQTVKHVAKGEEATADISAEQAAANLAAQQGEAGEEGSDDGEDDGDDDGEGDGEDDDDREEGELSDEEGAAAAGTDEATVAAPPETAPPNPTAAPLPLATETLETPQQEEPAVEVSEDVEMLDQPDTVLAVPEPIEPSVAPAPPVDPLVAAETHAPLITEEMPDAPPVPADVPPTDIPAAPLLAPIEPAPVEVVAEPPLVTESAPIVAPVPTEDIPALPAEAVPPPVEIPVNALLNGGEEIPRVEVASETVADAPATTVEETTVASESAAAEVDPATTATISTATETEIAAVEPTATIPGQQDATSTAAPAASASAPAPSEDTGAAASEVSAPAVPDTFAGATDPTDATAAAAPPASTEAPSEASAPVPEPIEPAASAAEQQSVAAPSAEPAVSEPTEAPGASVPADSEPTTTTEPAATAEPTSTTKSEEASEDLLGDLEKHLET